MNVEQRRGQLVPSLRASFICASSSFRGEHTLQVKAVFTCDQSSACLCEASSRRRRGVAHDPDRRTSNAGRVTSEAGKAEPRQAFLEKAERIFGVGVDARVGCMELIT